MSKSIGIQLVVYSLALAGLSYLVYHLAPSMALPTLMAGLGGGGLCLVWGIRAVAGHRGKAFPLLTLIPVNFVMLRRGGMAYNVSGDRGVQLELANGKRVLIGSQRAGELADAIREGMKREGRRRQP